MSLLEVEDLTVTIGAKAVVDHVSFAVDRSERLGIIGESGSGKTLSVLSIIGLTPDVAKVSGSIRFDGVELLGMRDRRLAKLRGEQIAAVFQNPLTSLNPLMRVGRQISETLRLHQSIGREQAASAAIDLAERVGLPDPRSAVRAYPHQLSGGQRQRVGIAIAIAAKPRLLIADEPTTALDVTVQAEIIALLDELIADEGTALLFITHDIALVSQVARSLIVMRHGQIVEHGDVSELIAAPRHPYTAELVAAARATSTDASAARATSTDASAATRATSTDASAT